MGRPEQCDLDWCIAASRQKQRFDIGTSRRFDSRHAGEDIHMGGHSAGYLWIKHLSRHPGYIWAFNGELGPI